MSVTARWCMAALLLVALHVCGISSATAADPVDWQADLAAAARDATRHGKLLLVVELSGDFALNAPDSPAAVLYRTVALGDERVRRALGERYVVGYRQVGDASSLRAVLPARAKAPRADDYALTYFCLPDSRVIHLVPGFVSADELLAELAWVERSYTRLVAAAAAEEALVLRQCHLSAAAAGDVAQFQNLFSTRWQDDELEGGPSTVDLPAGWLAAQTVFERNSTRASAAARQGAARALAAHGRLGVEMAHLVLSEFPLMPLDDLARPAFEACSGQRYWSASPRREAIARQWNEFQSSGQQVLVVVADDVFAAKNSQAAAFTWPPAADEWAELSRWKQLVVSIDELASLVADAGLAPLAFKVADGPPRFLLYHGDDKPAARISRDQGFTRLKQALAAVEQSGAPTRPIAQRRVEP
ncbi:MAG: hypothetical protein L0211_22390 [Planctomycetaceae bacterium]|nr:hypothetical protein [Planctomycetaceae bacterium]